MHLTDRDSAPPAVTRSSPCQVRRGPTLRKPGAAPKPSTDLCRRPPESGPGRSPVEKLTGAVSGHVTVRHGDRTSQLPMHGGRKELGRGLVAKIKKDLGFN